MRRSIVVVLVACVFGVVVVGGVSWWRHDASEIWEVANLTDDLGA